MKVRFFSTILLAPILAGQSPEVRALDSLEWRSIGPAAMGGRISGIEGVPGNPRIVYAATGSGGLFKTVNAGTTWQAIFERPGRISIGDIAIDPKNPDHVWVGTGEANLRNSVSIGGGVYYSPDGGKTWQRRGLESTTTISRLAIDPRDARRVLVAAVGPSVRSECGPRRVFDHRQWRHLAEDLVHRRNARRFRRGCGPVESGHRFRGHVAVRPKAVALR